MDELKVITETRNLSLDSYADPIVILCGVYRALKREDVKCVNPRRECKNCSVFNEKYKPQLQKTILGR
jgi:hypothetical protein